MRLRTVVFLPFLGSLYSFTTGAAQDTPTLLLVHPIQEIKAASGQTLPVFTVRLMNGSTPIAGRSVSISTVTAGSKVEGAVATVTNASGVAHVSNALLTGPAGEVTLRIESNAPASIDVNVTVTSGAPVGLMIVRQPSGLSEPDSALKPYTRLQLVDDFGNGVAGNTIVVMLCQMKTSYRVKGRTAAENSSDSLAMVQAVESLVQRRRTGEPDGSILDTEACSRNELIGSTLIGTTAVVTDRDGYAEFSDLKIQGKKSPYRLVFGLGSSMRLETFTTPIEHDPEAESTRSTVVISAIKSLSGKAPTNEFFDLRFMFRYSDRIFTLASVDVALTDRTTDSPSSTQEALHDAAASANAKIKLTTARSSDGRFDRAAFLGPGFRIFRTIPYYGAHIGSIELGGSAFQGSTGMLGFYSRFNGRSFVIGEDTITAAKKNLVFDFFIRSSTVAFFQTLNIRGTVLMPLDDEKGIESRIAIAVPLGTVRVF